jgi:TRAP-type C4-dicarboxylate transport system substrate-binding protein
MLVPMTSTGVAELVAAATLAATVLGGCAQGAHDRVGGRVPPEPTVLTLAVGEDGPGVRAWSDAVPRLSGGSLRIEERGPAATVAAVQRDDVDLAVVPAQALDRLRVPTFRGLLAPLVVDSYALQAKLLRGGAARRALAGVRSLGVVGIAVLPGALERVLTDGKPLLRASDFRSETFGVRPSAVTTATFHALGAAVRPLRPGGDENRFDGVEQSLSEIVEHRYGFVTPGRTVALNATLWPRVSVLIMNARAYHRLRPEQRAALSRAGGVAIGPATAQHVRAEAGATAVLCRPPHDDQNLFQLIWLTPSGQRSLRRAVRPVVRRLERDPASRAAIVAADAVRPTLGKPSPLICRGRAARRFRPTSPEPLQADAALSRTGPREWSSARLTLRGDALFRDRPVRRVMSVNAHLAGGLIRAWAVMTVAPDRTGGHSWDGPGVVFETTPGLHRYRGATVRFTGTTPRGRQRRLNARLTTDAPTGLR